MDDNVRNRRGASERDYLILTALHTAKTQWTHTYRNTQVKQEKREKTHKQLAFYFCYCFIQHPTTSPRNIITGLL